MSEDQNAFRPYEVEDHLTTSQPEPQASPLHLATLASKAERATYRVGWVFVALAGLVGFLSVDDIDAFNFFQVLYNPSLPGFVLGSLKYFAITALMGVLAYGFYQLRPLRRWVLLVALLFLTLQLSFITGGIISGASVSAIFCLMIAVSLFHHERYGNVAAWAIALLFPFALLFLSIYIVIQLLLGRKYRKAILTPLSTTDSAQLPVGSSPFSDLRAPTISLAIAAVLVPTAITLSIIVVTFSVFVFSIYVLGQNF